MSLHPIFNVRNGELYIENVRVMDLVERYGTPLHVISSGRIRQKYGELHDASKEYWRDTLICYAYKANSTLAILKFLKELGAGAEVVSGGELYAARLIGVRPDKIVFNGVSKSLSEIIDAITVQVGLLNIESLTELKIVNEIASKLNIQVNLGVRVNFDVPVKTHRYISTGMRLHKFGLDVGEAFKAYKLASKSKYIRVRGIHVHVGSQILSVYPFVKASSSIVSFAEKLYDALKLRLDAIDLGGGLGIQYSMEDKVLSPRDYCKNVFPIILEKIGSVFDEDSTIILEPGRYLVGDAGVLLTRVNYVKQIGNVKWVLVDAGMNDLIRPALYNAFHRVLIVNKFDIPATESYSVAGPICESADVFVKDYLLPKVDVGDVIAILDTGAYGVSMSSQYNCRPRAPVVMVDNSNVKLVRRRETYADVFMCDLNYR